MMSLKHSQNLHYHKANVDEMLKRGGYGSAMDADRNMLMDAAHERKPRNNSSLRNAGANIMGMTQSRQ